MTFSRLLANNRDARPRWLWWAMLILALVLALLPRRLFLPVKQTAQQAFAPGHYASAAVRERIDWLVSIAKRHLATVDDLSLAHEENSRLSADVRRLQAALLAAQAPQLPDDDVNHTSATDSLFDSVQPATPLLDWDVVEASVLGYRARAYLARQQMITGGEGAGFVPDNLVLEAAEAGDDDALILPDVLIDQGINARLADGQLAVAGRRVLGKLVEVGPEVSFVRRVNESGYRDLVQLATHDGQRLRLGPRGIVHGTGERLCRIRLVKSTEPVEVGDLVFAAGGEGLLEAHLAYGKVARVERSPGDVHWQIWMEPALPEETPEKVTVLRVQPNRVRLAAGDTSWE